MSYISEISRSKDILAQRNSTAARSICWLGPSEICSECQHVTFVIESSGLPKEKAFVL